MTTGMNAVSVPSPVCILLFPVGSRARSHPGRFAGGMPWGANTHGCGCSVFLFMSLARVTMLVCGEVKNAMLSHQQAVRPAGQGKLKNSEAASERQQVALLHFYIFYCPAGWLCIFEPDRSQPQVFCAGLVTDTAGAMIWLTTNPAWEGMQQAHASGTADRIAVIELGGSSG